MNSFFLTIYLLESLAITVILKRGTEEITTEDRIYKLSPVLQEMALETEMINLREYRIKAFRMVKEALNNSEDDLEFRKKVGEIDEDDVDEASRLCGMLMLEHVLTEKERDLLFQERDAVYPDLSKENNVEKASVSSENIKPQSEREFELERGLRGSKWRDLLLKPLSKRRILIFDEKSCEACVDDDFNLSLVRRRLFISELNELVVLDYKMDNYFWREISKLDLVKNFTYLSEDIFEFPTGFRLIPVPQHFKSLSITCRSIAKSVNEDIRKFKNLETLELIVKENDCVTKGYFPELDKLINFKLVGNNFKKDLFLEIPQNKHLQKVFLKFYGDVTWIESFLAMENLNDLTIVNFQKIKNSVEEEIPIAQITSPELYEFFTENFRNSYWDIFSNKNTIELNIRTLKPFDIEKIKRENILGGKRFLEFLMNKNTFIDSEFIESLLLSGSVEKKVYNLRLHFNIKDKNEFTITNPKD